MRTLPSVHTLAFHLHVVDGFFSGLRTMEMLGPETLSPERADVTLESLEVLIENAARVLSESDLERVHGRVREQMGLLLLSERPFFDALARLYFQNEPVN